MSNAWSWRAFAVMAVVFGSLVLVVNPSAAFSLDASDGILPRTGAEVPVLIGTAAFFLIIGFLLYWTGGFEDDK